MIPEGFLFSVAEAAIKKPGRKDLGLLYSKIPATIAGVFTTNSVKAAPVTICASHLKSGLGQAIVVNSGNANACTGKRGLKNAGDILDRLSNLLGIKASLIYPCSTGVIGTPMPVGRILSTTDKLVRGLGIHSLDEVAAAMMTTDTFPKVLHKRIKVGGKLGTISALCKGAGMIAPNMATMLCFVITDIAVQRGVLQSVLKDSVAKSFNRITIDGDMSTNDTVLVMANGLLGNAPISRKSGSFAPFRKAMDEILYELSRMVAKDGEGATKMIEVAVRNAFSEKDAEKAAFAVANSSLVKTAIYGNDANWGRIMCALGYSGIRLKEEKTDIFFNGIKVVRNGLSTNRDSQAGQALRSKEVKVTIDLHLGKSSARVLTCDLTEQYVRINAEYRT